MFLEAEALDLAEVRGTLPRCHTVGSHSNDVLVARVGSLVKGQRCLAREDADFALLGNKLPGENVGDGGVECNFDSRGVFDGNDSTRKVAFIAGAGTTVSTYRLTAPAGSCANL